MEAWLAKSSSAPETASVHTDGAGWERNQLGRRRMCSASSWLVQGYERERLGAASLHHCSAPWGDTGGRRGLEEESPLPASPFPMGRQCSGCQSSSLQHLSFTHSIPTLGSLCILELPQTKPPPECPILWAGTSLWGQMRGLCLCTAAPRAPHHPIASLLQHLTARQVPGAGARALDPELHTAEWGPAAVSSAPLISPLPAFTPVPFPGVLQAAGPNLPRRRATCAGCPRHLHMEGRGQTAATPNSGPAREGQPGGLGTRLPHCTPQCWHPVTAWQQPLRWPLRGSAMVGVNVGVMGGGCLSPLGCPKGQ